MDDYSYTLQISIENKDFSETFFVKKEIPYRNSKKKYEIIISYKDGNNEIEKSFVGPELKFFKIVLIWFEEIY